MQNSSKINFPRASFPEDFPHKEINVNCQFIISDLLAQSAISWDIQTGEFFPGSQFQTIHCMFWNGAATSGFWGGGIAIQIPLQSRKRALGENHSKHMKHFSSFIIIVPIIFAALCIKFSTRSTCSTKITRNFIAIIHNFFIPVL